MRNPNRIEGILKSINKIWKNNPDLRLCQLIGNCFDAGDLYHVEDEILAKRLIAVYEKTKKSTKSKKNKNTKK